MTQPKALELAELCLERKVDQLDFLYRACAAELLRQHAEIERLQSVNAGLLEALKKLACLGNGDKYGNSDGNCIAIEAIKKAEEA
jgi:hypothetical protein